MAKGRTHKKEKAIRHYGRKIHLSEDEVWTYEVKSVILVKDPDGNKHTVKMNDFTGWNWDELERASWKGYSPQIKPSHIKEWIESFKEGKEYNYEQ